MTDFEIVTTSAGAISIRNKIVNEIMHNPVGPWREANDLYIDQSRLRERLLRIDRNDLVLFDVGLGAASNALAAIHASLNLNAPAQRRLHIVSFENNLELLTFALHHAAEFEHMHGFEMPLQTLLDTSHWESPCGRIIWDLRAGDFLTKLDHEPMIPEIIFYDPYSPAVNQDMWTLHAFKKLFNHCQKNQCSHGTILYTYSVATPVRAALLIAGFFVGHGIPTGLKKETTEFATRMESLANPLSKNWFGRWVRSHTQLPYGTADDEGEVCRQLICHHPQMVPWLELSRFR